MERASSSSDAFGLLGLPPQFDLEPAVIERAFFERSKETHPDKFATAPAAERVAALSKSRAINDAYKLLKDPIARAEYLLAREGVTIGDNERMDPAFLADVLEMREELADAIAARNTNVVEHCRREMALRRDLALDTLRALFDRHAADDIKACLMRLRYIDRYLEACDAALDEE